jgi:hypothetical protein
MECPCPQLSGWIWPHIHFYHAWMNNYRGRAIHGSPAHINKLSQCANFFIHTWMNNYRRRHPWIAHAQFSGWIWPKFILFTPEWTIIEGCLHGSPAHINKLSQCANSFIHGWMNNYRGRPLLGKGRRGKFALSHHSRILTMGIHGSIIWRIRRILFHLNEQWMLDPLYTYSHYFNKSAFWWISQLAKYTDIHYAWANLY